MLSSAGLKQKCPDTRFLLHSLTHHGQVVLSVLGRPNDSQGTKIPKSQTS